MGAPRHASETNVVVCCVTFSGNLSRPEVQGLTKVWYIQKTELPLGYSLHKPWQHSLLFLQSGTYLSAIGAPIIYWVDIGYCTFPILLYVTKDSFHQVVGHAHTEGPYFPCQAWTPAFYTDRMLKFLFLCLHLVQRKEGTNRSMKFCINARMEKCITNALKLWPREQTKSQ